MIRKNLILSMGLSCVCILSSPLIAGPLYRYTDSDGVQALSRSLPPEAAQRGYDILDDKSMRLIKHVPRAPTAEEIAEMKKQAELETERQRQAEQAEKEAEEQRQQQTTYDRTLLSSYASEADLIKAKNDDINYRQGQIDAHKAKLPELEDYLYSLQQQAAERELSGRTISDNMNKRLAAAQEEIDLRKQAIVTLQNEIKDISIKYDSDLARLKALISANEN